MAQDADAQNRKKIIHQNSHKKYYVWVAMAWSNRP